MINKHFHEVVALNATPLPLKFGAEILAGLGIGTAIAGLFGASASVIGSSSTNKANRANVAETNAVNYAIAQETNAANAANVEKTNRTNLQIAQDNNRMQKQLQDEMNEYNSIGSQIARGADAGVNPNTILGGSVSGNTQTTLPQMQGANMIAPLMEAFRSSPFLAENPMKDLSANLNLVGDSIDKYYEAQKKKEETNKLGYETLIAKSDAYFRDRFNALNLDLTDSQVKKFSADSVLAYQQTQSLVEDIERIRATVESLNLDNRDKAIRNIFSFDTYKLMRDKLKSEVDWNDAQIDVALAMLPAQLGFIKSSTALNWGNVDLIDSMHDLTVEQIEEVKESVGLLKLQSYEQFLNNKYFMRVFNTRVKSEKGHLEQLDWQNTVFMKGCNAVGTVLGTASSALIMGYAGKGFFSKQKDFKALKPLKPSGNIGFGAYGQ